MFGSGGSTGLQLSVFFLFCATFVFSALFLHSSVFLSVCDASQQNDETKKKKSPHFFHPLIFILLHAALLVKFTCKYANTRSGVSVPTWLDLTSGATWNVSPPGSASGRYVQGEYRCVRNKEDCLFCCSCPLLADWVSGDMMDAKCL